MLKTPGYKLDTKKNIIKYKANTYVGINGGAADWKNAKGDIPYAGEYVEMWIAATAKKPASAKWMMP